MPKTRINVSLDQDLAEFAKIFAAENRTSVADMVTQYLLALKRRVEGKYIEKILARPFSRRWKTLRPNCAQEPHSGIHTMRSSGTDGNQI
jgi:hypothetical protein